MRFLNHHHTHNSDVATCARLKITPATINIINHGPYQTNGPLIYWGSNPTLSFSHKVCTSDRTKGDCHEKASPLAPRNGGSKGDPKVPKKYRYPYQESPLPASCTQVCTEIWKEQPVNAEHSCFDYPGGSGILYGWCHQRYQLVRYARQACHNHENGHGSSLLHPRDPNG